MEEKVILVDENDKIIGQEEKITAHKLGSLHRAFSIFITRTKNGKKELLLQKRHKDKYHSGRLWANSCCGHPRPGEDTKEAAERRLYEELGFTVPLVHQGTFYYNDSVGSGLIENEIDHLFSGVIDQDEVNFNPLEVEAIEWVPLDEIINIYVPARFGVWFLRAFNQIKPRL